MADFVLYLRLTHGERVNAAVEADTPEEALAGVEQALQSPTLLLRGIGDPNRVKVVSSTEILGYQIQGHDPSRTVLYALDLPAGDKE